MTSSGTPSTEGNGWSFSGWFWWFVNYPNPQLYDSSRPSPTRFWVNIRMGRFDCSSHQTQQVVIVVKILKKYHLPQLFARVLLAHMKYPVVPRRVNIELVWTKTKLTILCQVVISKRLAQCMHPALPSGVHQKALETYDIIFKCMGTNRCLFEPNVLRCLHIAQSFHQILRLAAELFIYSAGLFPLLANAALTVSWEKWYRERIDHPFLVCR